MNASTTQDAGSHNSTTPGRLGAEGPVLSIEGLALDVAAGPRTVRILDGVDLSVSMGETLALVGESGSGKSMTCMAATGLLDRTTFKVAGRAAFRRRDGEVVDLVGAPASRLRRMKGGQIGMVFQDPSTSLNPFYPIGAQIDEVLRLHARMTRQERGRRVDEVLDQVGIADRQRVCRQFPHELSGGMSQRVMIAMALACLPSLLIADEPTTALDVSIQAQILDLLRDLRHSTSVSLGMIIVTHNLGVVAEIADRVAVMYAGTVVETGSCSQVFGRPSHPYTRALLASTPMMGRRAQPRVRQRLPSLAGRPPNPAEREPGCAFAPRCPEAVPDCRKRRPDPFDLGAGHMARCIKVGHAR